MASFVTGLVSVVIAVVKVTTLVSPSLPGCNSTTLANGQSWAGLDLIWRVMPLEDRLLALQAVSRLLWPKLLSSLLYELPSRESWGSQVSQRWFRQSEKSAAGEKMTWCECWNIVWIIAEWLEWSSVKYGFNLSEQSGEFFKGENCLTHSASYVKFSRLHPLLRTCHPCVALLVGWSSTECCPWRVLKRCSDVLECSNDRVFEE